MEKIDRIRELFYEIKEGHTVFVKSTYKKQTKILEMYGWIFDELESLGVDRVFSESCLMWGKEFLDFEKQQRELSQPVTIEEAEAFLEAKAVDLTEEEKRRVDMAKRNNAMVWRVLPTIDGKVGIKIEAKYESVDKDE